MAVWTQPPKAIHEMVREHIEAKYPGLSLSMSIDADRRITHLEMADLSDEQMAALVGELQAKFPGAF